MLAQILTPIHFDGARTCSAVCSPPLILRQWIHHCGQLCTTIDSTVCRLSKSSDPTVGGP